jgi:hypothetical protein
MLLIGLCGFVGLVLLVIVFCWPTQVTKPNNCPYKLEPKEGELNEMPEVRRE